MTSDPTRHAASRPRVVAPLPPAARMFHIGPAKTGTTSLQAAGAASRERLLEHGVLYPGRARSQREAIASFLGRQARYNGAKEDEPGRPPPLKAWTDLVAEIAAYPGRVWFGHEYAAGASPAQVAGFAGALGDRLHVVITLRSFTRMLPSIWQEYNKAGGTSGFDGYVKRMLAVPVERREEIMFHRRHDHAGLVRRWADVVGIEQVTVVATDQRDHSFVLHAFEDLLALPRDLLAGAEVPSRAANRSMSAPEIELVRRLNGELRHAGLAWQDYERLLVRGGLHRMLSHRRPGPDEPRLRLTPRAAAAAEAYQREIVDGLVSCGVRVVGDLANLLEPAKVRTSPRENHKGTQSVPLDAAVEIAVGIIAAATGHTPDFEPIPQRRARGRRQHAREVLDHLGSAARSAVRVVAPKAGE